MYPKLILFKFLNNLISMGMEKYGCFMQMSVYYYWNHSQQSMKTRHVSKVIDVFQITSSCLVDTYFSFSALSSLRTQTCLHFRTDGRSLLLNMLNVLYIAYIIYECICLPLCAHILHFDAATFSIKLFSCIYFSDSVVRQRNEYKIAIETRPIKTT